MIPPCEICGRPAKAFRAATKKIFSKRRAQTPVRLPDHTLCPGCFRKEMDRLKAVELRELELEQEMIDRFVVTVEEMAEYSQIDEV